MFQKFLSLNPLKYIKYRFSTMSFDNKVRCFGSNDEVYARYHDEEWGIPLHDDNKLFELLILEGAQAGLSWITVLKKREGYRRAFHNFKPEKVSKMSDKELAALTENSEIVRNRSKIFATRQNAIAFLEIQKEHGSFQNYLWSYVNHSPIINNFKSFAEVPSSTPLSDAISKDLKKRGMNFVGPTIIYAYLQAVGVVNDHLSTCCTRTDCSSSHSNMTVATAASDLNTGKAAVKTAKAATPKKAKKSTEEVVTKKKRKLN